MVSDKLGARSRSCIPPGILLDPRSPRVTCSLSGRLACWQDWSTSIERRASCTWSWHLILAARTIYSSRRFFLSAHVLGVDAALGIGCARETLQCPLHGAVVDAAGGSERVCVQLWVLSCQVTFMMGACCTMIGWVRDVNIPG